MHALLDAATPLILHVQCQSGAQCNMHAAPMMQARTWHIAAEVAAGHLSG